MSDNRYAETEAAPLVSIIVPVFNHEQFVSATIASLLDQTYQNLELLIVDDGSADGSLNAVRTLEQNCQSRFARFVLLQQPNSGTAAALNRGIAASEGSFLFWLASDDLAEPEAISSLLPELICDPNIGLACGDADFIDAGGDPTTRKRGGKEFSSSIDYYLAEKPDFDLDVDFGSYRSFIGPYYMPIGCLVRRSHFLAAGYFDPSYVSEDSDLWLRLSKVCRFKFVQRTLCHRRLHQANTHLTMRERLSFDDVRLLVREARHCINNGLADQWQRYIEKRLDDHHRLLTKRKPAREGFFRRDHVQKLSRQSAVTTPVCEFDHLPIAKKRSPAASGVCSPRILQLEDLLRYLKSFASRLVKKSVFGSLLVVSSSQTREDKARHALIISWLHIFQAPSL